MVQGEGLALVLVARGASLARRVGVLGCSYQTEPAEVSKSPSLLKSPMPTPSLRKARSRVVFLKLTLADWPPFACASGFDAGKGRAGTGEVRSVSLRLREGASGAVAG